MPCRTILPPAPEFTAVAVGTIKVPRLADIHEADCMHAPGVPRRADDPVATRIGDTVRCPGGG